MANIKKAINILSERINQAPTNLEASKVLNSILYSYELQIRYGVNDKIYAFSNSIYTPSKKPNTAREKVIQLTKKRKLSQHFKYCLRYEHIIKELREKGLSDEKIAKLLNAQYIHKKDFYDRRYINKYRKERGIK